MTAQNVEVNAKLSGYALAYLWEPSSNIIGVKFNPTKKSKGVNIRSNLSVSDLQGLRLSTILKRQVINFCNGVYDLIEMASPYTNKLKLLMRGTPLS